MKKFLSLVLALVMTMSLVTISSGAADFADKSSITYDEAVDVISAIGVVDGDNGSFRPTDTLTRQAAAKIICNLLLGPTTASALVADTAPYPDVPTTSQFAGYIAYCQKSGIISGYADGTFKPTGTLTGYAFMKMLLTSLGYRTDIEGYTGANWTVSVAKRALGIGLNADLEGEFNGNKAVTREEAALYALNMLQADLVYYPNNNSITIDGTTITSGVTVATAVDSNTNSTTDKNDDNIPGTGKHGKAQFAEMYFTNLVLYTNDDAFGRPANTWYYKGIKVGTYADTAKATYYKNVKLSDIYADLNMTAAATQTTIYMNGIKVSDGLQDNWNGSYYAVGSVVRADYNVSKGNSTKLASLDNGLVGGTYSDHAAATAPYTQLKDNVGAGTITEAFLDTSDNSVTICVMSVYGGKISDVKAASSTKDAYVIVEGGTKVPEGNVVADFTKSGRNEFETTDFAEGDVVAFTYSQSEHAIKTMYKLESKEGSLTRRVVSKSIQLGDDTYAYAQDYTFGDGLTEDGLTNKSTYVVYFDDQGNALYIEEGAFSVSDYAYVESITNTGDGLGTNRARLVLADGSKMTVDLDKDYINVWDADSTQYYTISSTTTTAIRDASAFYKLGILVRFSKNSSGEYKLTKVTGTANGHTATGSNTFQISSRQVTSDSLSAYSFDSNTVFVVRKAGSNTWSTYTGIKNVPEVTFNAADNHVSTIQEDLKTGVDGAVTIYNTKDGVAKLVFIDGATVANKSSNVTFIAAASASKLNTSKSDDVDYYTYNAVVNGVITTVDVNAYYGTGTNNEIKGHGANNAVVTLYAGDKYIGGNPANKSVVGLILNDVEYNNDNESVIDVSSFSSSTVITGMETKVTRISSSEIKLGNTTWDLASNVAVYEVDKDGDIEEITASNIVTDSTATAYYTVEKGEITNLFIVRPNK
jgi:hypothetical protein